MENSRFQYLYQRWISNQCNPDELEELRVLFTVDSNEELSRKLLQDAFVHSKGEKDVSKETADAIFQAIIHATDDLKEVPVKRINFSGKWVGVAAAVLVVLVGGYIWLTQYQQQVKEVQIVENNHNVIVPGREGAILKLADGSQIVLDTISEGLIKAGEGIEFKLSPGEIAYNAEAKNEAFALQWNTLTTPKGRLFSLYLPDGTKVWLNAASSIRFPVLFSKKERRVEVSGEAYFEVAKDKIPFIVSTGLQSIEVLGTHFNVNAYNDEFDERTTLVEGSVRVRSLIPELPDDLVLIPGQQAVLATQTPLTLNKAVDIQQVLAWKNGKFHFETVDIGTVMRQISRWYDVEVEYRGEVTTRFWGSISRYSSVSKVLEMLEMTGGVNFKIEGKKIIVMP